MTVMRSTALLSIAVSMLFAGLGESGQKLQPVSGFDLDRYLGKWYEIARLPARFERDLVNVTATYSLRKDGKVRVVNEGYKKTREGKHKVAVGKAKFAGARDEGYLRVSFFGPFYGDYVIIELDQNEYSYAVVASSLKYLWILSREPQMDRALIESLIEEAKGLGFDTDRLYFTPQDR
jgi:apolipoprotein D and lipocalin family protein